MGRTLAQLVLAYAKFDLNKAMQAAKKLPPFDQDCLSVDINTLEESAFSMGKNLKRAPKNYTPGSVPDPERWLPRRERTGLKYLPGQKRIRKDKRKGEKFTGAQGTAQGQADNFDYSSKVGGAGTAAAKETVKASPQPEPVVGPRQQKRSQAKSKKKGGKKAF